MASELSQAIKQVCEEKRIPVESVVETIESALGAAYRKDFGNKLQNIKVDFDMETGGFKVFDIKEVVEDELKAEYEKIKEERMKLAEDIAAGLVSAPEKKEDEREIEEAEIGEDEVKKFNPKTMISLSEAKELKKNSKLGDELISELQVPGDFGRMAAQTAKQVIIQKLREAERNTVFEEYQDKVGELLTGTVQRQEGKIVLVDFGNTTAVMPIEEGIRTESYRPGARFKFYVKNVEQSVRGPRIIVSRAHPEILRKLFKLEVPEIAAGTVQIKSIAREAGSRSKIAVMTKEANVDPIGSCVGQRGTRVQTIINELGGEKIDIIEWVEEPEKFIAKALSPAKVIRVVVKESKNQESKKANPPISESDNSRAKKADQLRAENQEGEEGGENDEREQEYQGKEATVYVHPDQLSLAIGKEGQNVRLAAKLTGWRIDILEDNIEHAGETPTTTDSSDSTDGEVIEPKNQKIKKSRKQEIKENEGESEDEVGQPEEKTEEDVIRPEKKEEE